MKTKREYKSIFRILSHGRVGLFVSGVLASLFCANNAYALPQGGQLKDGQATISLPSSTQMNINQASNRAIIDWQSFNIAANEKLNIVQPSSNAMLLSRVVGNDPSKIFGQITANGGLMLINQNGILFGKGSKVDVAALVASTANIKNEDFMAGKMRFMTPSNPNAKIINEGTITAKDGGLVALVAPYVQNNGFIIAKYGTVAIAGASTATIDLYGDNLIVFETPDELKKTIENSGTIEAGYVAMSISDAKKVVDSSINMSGIIKAQNIDTSGGKVVLTGGNINLSGTIEAIGANGDGGNVKVVADMNSGTLDFGGKIDISSQNGNGGFAETSGNSVKISNTASVNAKGKKYGEWLIDPNDYTILADGTGDITGAALSASLENANVTISTTTQGHSGNGDIFVYDNIIWNANTILSLNAEREIHINNDITAHGNTAGIVLNPAINFFFYDGAKINLDGSNPTVNIRGQNYTVITALNTVDQLRTLSTGGNMNGYYVLAVDINTWAPPGQTVNMLPIGTNSNPFNGMFEGFGHTINGMQVNNSGNNTPTGMFGRIGENGFVRNLTISNPTVVGGTVDGVGALAGINNGGIEYVVIDGGSVTSSTNMTGGLVGFNNNISHPAQIFNSGSTATVTSSGDNVGGLVGASIDSILGNVYAEGAVTGHDTVGGLVGGLWASSGSSSLINAYATGNVTGNYLVGGLVGETSTYTTISNAYSDGDVTGGYKVGGLIGESSGTVSNTYATGDVYASRGAVGGLIGGMMEGSVTRSFAVGNVSTAGNNPVSVSDGNGGTVTVYPVDAGGFVGTMENGSISQSWSSGNVEITKVGGMYGGGFVGHMWAGSIADSKSHGNVTTRGDYTGGFAGELTSGSVVRVLATGTVFTTGAHVGGVYGYIRFAPSNSMFYDQDTVGNVVGINDGGIGKTTAQLKNAATFVGWDMDTTNTDPNRVWTIYDPSEYPGLHSTGYSMVDGYMPQSAPVSTLSNSSGGSSSNNNSNFNNSNSGSNSSGTSDAQTQVSTNTIDPKLQYLMEKALTEQTKMQFITSERLIAFNGLPSELHEGIADNSVYYLAGNTSGEGSTAQLETPFVSVGGKLVSRGDYNKLIAPENTREAVKNAITNTVPLVSNSQADKIIDLVWKDDAPSAVSKGAVSGGLKFTETTLLQKVAPIAITKESVERTLQYLLSGIPPALVEKLGWQNYKLISEGAAKAAAEGLGKAAKLDPAAVGVTIVNSTINYLASIAKETLEAKGDANAGVVAEYAIKQVRVAIAGARGGLPSVVMEEAFIVTEQIVELGSKAIEYRNALKKQQASEEILKSINKVSDLREAFYKAPQGIEKVKASIELKKEMKNAGWDDNDLKNAFKSYQALDQNKQKTYLAIISKEGFSDRAKAYAESHLPSDMKKKLDRKAEILILKNKKF